MSDTFNLSTVAAVAEVLQKYTSTPATAAMQVLQVLVELDVITEQASDAAGPPGTENYWHPEVGENAIVLRPHWDMASRAALRHYRELLNRTDPRVAASVARLLDRSERYKAEPPGTP